MSKTYAAVEFGLGGFLQAIADSGPGKRPKVGIVSADRRQIVFKVEGKSTNVEVTVVRAEFNFAARQKVILIPDD